MKQALDFKQTIRIENRDSAEIVSESQFEELVGIKYVVVKPGNDGALLNLGQYSGRNGAISYMKSIAPKTGRVMLLDDWNKLPVINGKSPDNFRKCS